MVNNPRCGAMADLAASSLVDATGMAHQPASSGARIVSLVPSITETLFALGLEEALVGRTAFCIHPRDRVKRVRSVGGTKRINTTKLHAIAPTHVIVNIDETPKPLADSLNEAGYTVIVTHPIEVEDNRALFTLLGGLFGRVDQAHALCQAFDAAMADLAEVAATLPERRVLYLIWKDPWMTVSAETYVAKMLGQVHWRVIGGDGAVRYPEIPLNDRLLSEADLVLFSSEPFPFVDRHIADFRSAHPRHAHKARTIDGEMTSWYGVRAIAGLRYLATLAESTRQVAGAR